MSKEDQRLLDKYEYESLRGWFDGKQNNYISYEIKPLAQLITRRNPDTQKWDMGWRFPSLLDACYLMLMLDVIERRRLIRCEWCQKLSRLRLDSPHNARYCPPEDKSRSQTWCSTQASKLKSYQAKNWNNYLKNKYKTIDVLENAWGFNPQKKKGIWILTRDYSIPHPLDLRKKLGPLPKMIKSDYCEWRKKSRFTNPKHNLFLKDEYILSK